jgi:hypothetical protein
VKSAARLVLLLAGLLTAAGVPPSMGKENGPVMEPLEVTALIRTQPVRLSRPCQVEIRVTNRSPDPVLVNRRLAVGYREGQAREVFAEVYRRGSDEIVSRPALLYQRDFSPPEDYVRLPPGHSVETTFALFEWYSLPSAGEFDLVVSYQADEPLAPKPAGLLGGIHTSDRVAFSVEP